MLNILIVEDNTAFRRELKEILRHGFPDAHIAQAASAEDALRKIEKDPPDLVFADIRLPGATGLELTKAIKSRLTDVVVVILTNYDLPEYHEAAKNSKADHFMLKGATKPHALVSKVQKLM